MTEVALITGANGGIGHALVRVFQDSGYVVVGTDRAEAPEPAPCRFVALDLSRPEAIVELIAGIEERESRLDVVINNAAVQVARGLSETSVEEWDLTMAVNVRAPFLIAREGRRLLRQRGGAIVNIASVHAEATSPGLAAYAASKGALVALTRSLALELAGDAVRVNAILPGAIDTAMLEAGLARQENAQVAGSAMKARLASRTPVGRIGRAEEVAQAALFLADDERSSFITGAALVADGGALSRLSTE